MSKYQLGGDYPEATEKLDRGVLGFFSAAERILLVIISLLTMLAVALELTSFFERSSAWRMPTTRPTACPSPCRC